MIAIVDYGIGNIGSVANMLRRIGAPSEVVSSPSELRLASGIILPGVGAFDKGIEALRTAGFADEIYEAVGSRQVPLLGICLGMQLLLSGSDEGVLPGLDLIPGRVRKFPFGPDSPHRVPHMGWSTVRSQRAHPLLDGLDEAARFYFVHSYYADPALRDHVLAESNYGIDFAALIGSGRVFGAQFHPEKSHRFGLQLLANFSALSA